MLMATTPPRILLLSLLASSHLPLHASSSSATAPSSTSSSLYTSVASLDRYGNSQQIQNAKKCSTRRGTLVVAAVGKSNENDVEGGGGDGVVVCSLHRPTPGVKQPSTKRGMGIVHLIATSDEYDMSKTGSTGPTVTAAVFSGLKSDSTLLLSILRSHSRKLWERYDTIPTSSRIGMCLSEILLTFMGYDRSKELNDGAGPVVGRDEEELEMARPFGVQSFILGVGQYGGIWDVDAGGVVSDRIGARAMGSGSDEANKLLQSRWKRGLTLEEVRELCVGIVRDVMKEKEEEREGMEVLCEQLTEYGSLRMISRVPSGLQQEGGK